MDRTRSRFVVDPCSRRICSPRWYISPLVYTVAVPLKRKPFRRIGSTTLISTCGLACRLATVPGDAMSAKKSRSSSHSLVVPFGDRLGRPSGVTVATNPSRCSRTTRCIWSDSFMAKRYSAMSFRAPPSRYRCADTEPAEGTTDEREEPTSEPPVHRETAEEREQGRLDLRGHALFGGLLRYPRAGQGPRHR